MSFCSEGRCSFSGVSSHILPRPDALGRLITLATATLAAAAIASPPAALADTTDVTFYGGTLAGLTVDPAFTQGSFQNLSYRYESCGTEPAEETCTWRLRASLHSDPAHRCVPSTPASQLLLDSGERSGNGVFESGPVSFALEGCSGQILSIYYETEKTFNPDEEEGPWKSLAQGGGGTLLWLVIGGDASKANPWEPVPSTVPSKTPLALAVSANCHSLKNRQHPLHVRLPSHGLPKGNQAGDDGQPHRSRSKRVCMQSPR